ncbi:reverse transcriptase/maturase family protein [Candidatus Woesearchaeota archaeon]|nr:reverse transcriptase/maturase family protein [Candidatus Woesearchaeota archaeon]
MKTYNNLYPNLISPENLENAYWKARKHKSKNPKVIEFEKHWRLHLAILHKELRTRTYKPKPLKKFILRDPKTRTICVSSFRDRIVHHALINILQPIFEPRFICDSYASRKLKGTLPAIKRFYQFLRKTTKNSTRHAFVLKADIKHYFQTVDHTILLEIIRKRIKDENTIWLIKTILDNNPYTTTGKGMPLGNWTSQFFANIYLNELDQYVQHILRIKHYIRYVDDFVIMERSKDKLQGYENEILVFLNNLKLKLHPNKCKIIPVSRPIKFLGFRCSYHHMIPLKRNIRKILNKLGQQTSKYETGIITADEVFETLKGWSAYAMHGNTHHLRERITNTLIEGLMLKTA